MTVEQLLAGIFNNTPGAGLAAFIFYVYVQESRRHAAQLEGLLTQAAADRKLLLEVITNNTSAFAALKESNKAMVDMDRLERLVLDTLAGKASNPNANPSSR